MQSCDILVSKNKQNWETIHTGLDASEMHHNKYGGIFALRPALMSAGKESVKFNDFIYKPQM